MKQSLPAWLAIFLLCVLYSPPASPASKGDSSGEIWVDGPLAEQPGSDPNYPDAAVNPSGRSVFVWDGTSGATRKEIFMRVYPADGGPPSTHVQVNTTIDNAQHAPRIAIRDDGSFLVVWQSDEKPFPEAGYLREVVRSQAFDAGANPVGEEQLLSTLLPELATGHSYANIAVLNNGDYMVAWRSKNTAQPGDTSVTIQARRVGADGLPKGDQFQVNSTISSAGENYPTVTALADGGFLVVWTVPQVHGRRFAADGSPVGDDFQINTLEAGSESVTDAATDEDGRVLVIWQDAEESGDHGTEIRGRLYSSSLAAQGPDFRINNLITSDQRNPRVADYGELGFFVVWESYVSAGTDIEPRSIEGRIVTGGGAFTGPQFTVNSWTEDSQHHVGIGGANGRIAVAWHSQSNEETTRNVINGQFWNICGIFCSGFE